MDYVKLFQLHEIITPVNPMGREADQHSRRWARKCGLVLTEESDRRLAATRPGMLAAHCYPSASLPNLRVLADWMTWLFSLDDQVDEGPLGRHPDLLERAFAGGVACLENSDAAHAKNPLWIALHDLVRRFSKRIPEGLEYRFRHHVMDYFRACVWQAAHRQGAIPDLETFPQMRRDAGAIMPSFDLIEFSVGAALPTELYYSATYQRLLISAANVVCWTNDVMTVEKEMARGDDQNLILVVQKNKGISLDAATADVIRRIRDQIKRFLKAEEELPHTLDELLMGDGQRDTVARCVALLRAWMRGHVDWGQVTARYLEIDRSDGHPAYLENLLQRQQSVIGEVP
ncbi:terpene synthase family protein [Streptomyces virginiae]|uniref:terpene synthase family protein n=1 Tax=Streptomyces virginiae TaxID=1961 RepID=UPI00369C5117